LALFVTQSFSILVALSITFGRTYQFEFLNELDIPASSTDLSLLDYAVVSPDSAFLALGIAAFSLPFLVFAAKLSEIVRIVRFSFKVLIGILFIAIVVAWWMGLRTVLDIEPQELANNGTRGIVLAMAFGAAVYVGAAGWYFAATAILWMLGLALKGLRWLIFRNSFLASIILRYEQRELEHPKSVSSEEANSLITATIALGSVVVLVFVSILFLTLLEQTASWGSADAQKLLTDAPIARVEFDSGTSMSGSIGEATAIDARVLLITENFTFLAVPGTTTTEMRTLRTKDISSIRYVSATTSSEYVTP